MNTKTQEQIDHEAREEEREAKHEEQMDRQRKDMDRIERAIAPLTFSKSDSRSYCMRTILSPEGEELGAIHYTRPTTAS